MRIFSLRNSFALGAACLTGGMLALPAAADLDAPIIERLMQITQGTASVEWDGAALRELGLSVGSASSLAAGAVDLPISTDSSLQVVVVNDQVRRALGGDVNLATDFVLSTVDGASLSLGTLTIQPTASQSEPYEYVVLSGTQRLFDLTGVSTDFDAATSLLSESSGNLRVTQELAQSLGQPAAAGRFVGQLSFAALLETIQETVYDGSDRPFQVTLPPSGDSGTRGFPNPGPDVIVGVLPSMSQFGRAGSFVGLAIGTSSCNKGNVPLHWFSLPNTDHPVIPQNLYRLRDDRFEQIGQSWLKHAFTALQLNECGFGCQGGCSGSTLCPGCSDPYGAGLNASQGGLGSRAWVNPFTGAYPSNANNHTGHVHDGVTHRIRAHDDDLDQSINGNGTAIYYGEGQYVSPHEYLPNNGIANNQYNNVSHRRFSVTGVSGGTYSFTGVGNTIREQPAINAWTGSTQSMIEPEPGVDGVAILAYKVTQIDPDTWHYEYAVYNMNLDRSIQSFSVPIPTGTTVTNIGFHAPPQHPGIANDGIGGGGYSGTPWVPALAGGQLTWSTQTFAENPAANAIRWGTLYNFRFDADRPPRDTQATVGFFKTGGPMMVAAQAPAVEGDLDGDGDVDFDDLVTLLNCYQVSDCGDLDGDGDTDFDDLFILLSNYGS